MLSMPKPEPEVTLVQRSDGRFEVAENGYVLKVAGTLEQCRAWLNAYLMSKARPNVQPEALYNAVLRTK